MLGDSLGDSLEVALVRQVQEWRSDVLALLRETYGARHIICLEPLGGPAPSIAARLAVLMPGSTPATARATPFPTPADAVSWAETTFRLNQCGVLVRLKRYDEQLSQLVDLLLNEQLARAVTRHRAEFAVFTNDRHERDDRCGEIGREFFVRKGQRFCLAYDPSLGSLATFLFGETRLKGLSAESQRGLGIEYPRREFPHADLTELSPEDEQGYHNSALNESVATLLRNAPEELQRHGDGVQQKDIAVELGVSARAIEGRFYRFRNRIRQLSRRRTKHLVLRKRCIMKGSISLLLVSMITASHRHLLRSLLASSAPIGPRLWGRLSRRMPEVITWEGRMETHEDNSTRIREWHMDRTEQRAGLQAACNEDNLARIQGRYTDRSERHARLETACANYDGSIKALAAIAMCRRDSARVINDDLRDIRYFIWHDDPAVRRAALTSLAAIADAATLSGTTESRTAANRLLRMLGAAEPRLALLRRPFAIFADTPTLVQWAWTIMGIVITGFASVAVFHQAWGLAFSLLAGRVVLSLAFGDRYNLPFEGRTRPDSRFAVVTRCLAGHVSDSMILVSVSAVLIITGHAVWGGFALVAAMIMVLATLYRVASLQVGVQLQRLQLERVFRVVSVLIAISSTAVSPDGTLYGMPFLALAGVGALVYGLLEIFRVAWRLRHEDRHQGSLKPNDVAIRVTRSNAPAPVILRAGYQLAKRQPVHREVSGVVG